MAQGRLFMTVSSNKIKNFIIFFSLSLNVQRKYKWILKKTYGMLFINELKIVIVFKEEQNAVWFHRGKNNPGEPIIDYFPSTECPTSFILHSLDYFYYLLIA